MSGYDKSQDSYVYDYATTRSSQQQSYAGSAQPSFASQYLNTPSQESHGLPATGQMPFLSEQPHYDSRDSSFQPHYTTFIDPGSRNPLPVVKSYLPQKGTPGTKVHITLQSTFPLTGQRTYFFFTMIGDTKKPATFLSKGEHRAPFYQYGLSAEIPTLDTSVLDENTMPLWLDMQDESGQSIGLISVGDFTYEDPSKAFPHFPTPHDVSRKRKLSVESSEETMRSPPKRMAGTQMQTAMRDPSGIYIPAQGSLSPASPYLRSNVPSAYSLSSQQQGFYQHDPQKLSYRFPQVSGASRPAISSQTPGYSSYLGMGRPSASPTVAPARPASSGLMLPQPTAHAGNPTLIRTSILQSPTGGGVSGGTQPFNPYSMYPNSKANLKIEGDLESMAQNWTEDEWDVQRRLVQFHRQQTGSTITVNFKPVAPEKRSTNSICVSCIWWQEKKDCYITSVDTIFLLESIVAVRFTVEEKNRIRRNLEGFRPLTVAKSKPESEKFFKLIMDFPNPKPRNIEKDVKVFPWKILSHALKKIISKYSASYSSTAGALPSQASSGYTTTSESGNERRPTASPRSATSSAASNSYTTIGMTSTAPTALSPTMSGSAGPEGSAGTPNLRVAVPQLGTHGAQSLSQWQLPPYAPAQQYPSTVPTANVGRASWDLSAYLETSPQTATPGAAQSMHYYQGSTKGSISEAKQAPGADSYQQYGQRTTQS